MKALIVIVWYGRMRAVAIGVLIFSHMHFGYNVYIHLQLKVHILVSLYIYNNIFPHNKVQHYNCIVTLG